MPKKILCISPFSGELGWEIVNYIPYVNGIRRAHKFDLIFACVRSGRERLYSFANRFMLTNLEDDVKVSGNFGPMNKYRNRIQVSFENRVGKMRGRGWECTVSRNMTKHDRGMFPGRKFICYKASKEEMGLCHTQYGEKYAVILVRTRRNGRGKNWPIANFDRLGTAVESFGFTPVYVGSGSKHKFSCGINLLGGTTVSDVIPILCGASFAVGGSTGTLHLAAMCKTPHFVWGNKRLVRRYKKDWNPFDTKVHFLKDYSWKPPVKSVVSGIKNFVDEVQS